MPDLTGFRGLWEVNKKLKRRTHSTRKPKPKRSHGLSRLEKLLHDSIRLELAQKRMYRTLRRELLELSARIARVEGAPGITPEFEFKPWVSPLPMGKNS